MLRNFNIGRRLGGIFLVCALLLTIVGGFGVYSSYSVNKSFGLYVYHVVEAAQQAGNIRAEMINLRRFEKDMVIHVADPAKVKEYQQQWNSTYEYIDGAFGELKPRLRDPEVK